MIDYDIEAEDFAEDFDCAERLQWYNEWTPPADETE